MVKSHGNEKVDVKTEFAKWCALPKGLRVPKTQIQFAKKYHIGLATTSRWKDEDKFWEEVEIYVKRWAKESLPSVLAALSKNIEKRGASTEVKLWLQWVMNWKEKMETENPQLNEEVEKLRGVLKSMIQGVRNAK